MFRLLRLLACSAATLLLLSFAPIASADERSVGGDLNCDGRLTIDDIAPFVLRLLDEDAYATAWNCEQNADLNLDNTADGRDIERFVEALTHAQPPTIAQLAGNSLYSYPSFEYVRSFNRESTVEVAIEPSRFPQTIGGTCDIYVVHAKSKSQWIADPQLVDVRTGGLQTITIDSGSIAQNVHIIAQPEELDGPEGTDLAAGYDVVFDFNRDGFLNGGDMIDGYGDIAGFYIVRDTTRPGPLPVSEALYSGGAWLGQDIYYPAAVTAMGKLPLVVISHGNGHNYTWYDHIGYHLASHGYIVMSHTNMTGPGTITAAQTTLTNTDHFLGGLATIAGGVLNGHVDNHRIVWIGHSRGGEGVVIAYRQLVDGVYQPQNFTADDIVLISSMAPVDFNGPYQSSPGGVSYHLWTAAGDDDVSGAAGNDELQTFHLYERATGWRQSTVIHGAGHGDFHAADGSVFEGPCQITPKSDVHDIIKGYLLPLIKFYVDGDPAAKDFLWRQYEHFAPSGVPDGNFCIEAGESVVVTNEFRQSAESGRLVLDDYQTQTSTATSSAGRPVTYTVQHISEGLLRDVNSDFTWASFDVMNGMTRARADDTTRGVTFDWIGNAYYELGVPPGDTDFTRFDYLSFRAAQQSHHPYTVLELVDLTFSVQLRDGQGRLSWINIGAYGGGIEENYQREGGWFNEFETIRIRLTDFLNHDRDIDLTNIVAVRFLFGLVHGAERGRIGLDDVELTTDVSPHIASSFEMSLPNGITSQVEPDDVTPISFRIHPRGEAYVAGSGRLYYRVEGGEFVSQPLTPLGDDIYYAALPAVPCGSTIDYYVSAEGSISGMLQLPASAPGATFNAVSVHVETIFATDFTSDPGWTVSGDAVFGAWSRGTPLGHGDEGDPPNDFDGNGICWLTASGDGDADVDAGVTILASTLYDLSNTVDPYVTYARWFDNDGGDSPLEDVFLVEASDDGGATWTPVESLGPYGPQVHGGWYVARFRIADFVTLTDQFRIRWQASDYGNDSRVEAAIDAFGIYDGFCD